MSISRKVSSFLAVTVLAGLSLAACGDEDEPKKAGSGDKPAASQSAASDAELTKETFFSRVMTAQQDARTSHVDMTIGAGGQTIKARGDVEVGESLDDAKMSMTMDMGSAGPGTMTMLLIDRTFYLNLGEATGDKFAMIDLDDKSNPLGKQFGQLLDQADPSKQLEQFKEAVTSFEQKGQPQKIDGVEATPYELVLDTSKIDMLEAAGAAQLPERLTYVMYVGPDDLLRRMTFEVAGTSSQLDYSGWGEPVDIEKPAAGDITEQDLSQLMGGQLQG